MDDPRLDESNGEHGGLPEGAPTQETLVQKIPAFEEADLDVVKPELSHEGDVTTFPGMETTNEPSERMEKRVRFSENIPLSPPHKPNLTMTEIVNLEYSGLRRSGRIWDPTQRAKESNESRVRKMFDLFTTISLETVSNIKPVITEPRPHIYFTRGLNHIEEINTLIDNSINDVHAMVFEDDQEQNDNFTFKNMMRQDDCQQFIDSMMEEVNEHEDREHWILMK